MQVVIDTNVIVSGILKPSNPPGEIIDMLFSGQVEPVYDDRILNEYSIVLRREKFSFPPETVNALLGTIQTIGIRVIPLHRTISMPDDHDRCFIECALVSRDKIIVTGNKKHFPPSSLGPVKAFSPKEFMELPRP
jgi:putative PIN family toxin of toxin-antitoxin system